MRVLQNETLQPNPPVELSSKVSWLVAVTKLKLSICDYSFKISMHLI
jgi:hypothetical protein